MVGVSRRALGVPAFVFSGFVGSLVAGGCEAISQDEVTSPAEQERDSVGELAQSLNCYVGGPSALGSACARANEAVSLTAGALSSASPPLIEVERAAYGVRLIAAAAPEGSREGSVRVRPARSGSYNLYLGAPNLPLRVRGPAGEVSSSCSSPVSATECNKLRRVNTYELEADQEYRIEVGPTSAVRYLRLHVQTLEAPLAHCSAEDSSELDPACAAAEAGAQRLDASEVGGQSPPDVVQDLVYGVRLPSVGAIEFAGEFVFTPSVTGEYQVYLGTPRIPLAVSGSQGPVPASCTRDIHEHSCLLLRRGDVYSLFRRPACCIRLGISGCTDGRRL